MNRKSSRDRSKAATIADVADLAGVAKSTVSNYLNGQVRVSDPTAARIAMAINKLDYKPAMVARSLTSRRRAEFDGARLPPGLPCLTTVGQVSIETLAEVAAPPESHTRITTPEILRVLGGPSANVAAMAASLGGELGVAASLVTSLGNDLNSDWVTAELAGRHVSVIGQVEHRDGRIAQELVLVEAGGRRMVISEPASLVDGELRQFLARIPLARDRRWCLHLDGNQLSVPPILLDEARAAGFHLTMQSDGLTADDLARRLDWILDTFEVAVLNLGALSQEECGTLIERLSRSAVQRHAWPEAVIVVDGAGAPATVDVSGKVHRRHPPTVSLRDQGGMCDAIVATSLAAWLNGVPAERGLSLAVASAGLVGGTLGSQELRPSLEELEPLLNAPQSVVTGHGAV